MASPIGEKPEFVYRISTASEWEELQSKGSTFGGDLDKSTAFFHLSNLDQVISLSLCLSLSSGYLSFVRFQHLLKWD